MSRAYRISVRESSRRVIKAEDRVSTQLEILEILPPEAMAELLAGELEERGFEREGELLVRKRDGVKVTVDPKTGEVVVAAEASKQEEVKASREERAYDDAGPSAKAVREQLKQEVQKDMDRQAEKKTQQLQTEVTQRLERQLDEVRRELDEAVSRVTREALKQKAAQMGEIKEMSEDAQSGSLTIVIEV